ncbi:MAG: hypothetical protein NTY30_00430 [Candidatus Berkelbacteria bacterium]|nr:hypothetical protein [Candidatus Berkelbacteria bacterium]
MKESKFIKIVTFVPESHADAVRQAMGDAGAGVIGKYTHCFSSSKSIGSFMPGSGANPTIGEVGRREEVEEIRIETLCDKKKVSAVKDAILKSHPYEEVSIDIYPMLET